MSGTPGLAFPDRLADQEDVTLTTPALGDLLMKSGGDWLNLAPGGAGQLLQSNGAGAALTWAPPPAPGVTDHGLLTGLGDDDHPQYPLLAGRAGGQTLTGGSAASNNLTLLSTSHATKGKINFGTGPFVTIDGTAGWISCPGGVTAGERFGSGSSVTGNSSVAFGFGATAGFNSVAIGSTAAATGQTNVVIGGSATTGAFTQSVILGQGANATGGSAVAIGYLATAGANATAVGGAAGAGFTSSIALGYQATTTAVGQFVVGSTTANITTAYFGKGVTHAAPSAVTLNATGGSGTDIAGANLQLAGGQGTGAAVGGSILFRYAPAGTTGTGLNALATAVTISGANGSLSCPGTSGSSERFGAGSIAGGNNSVAIGNAASANNGSSIAIGGGATTTVANQCVIGSSAGAITTLYIGKGVTDAAPSANVTLNVTHVTSGSGTDVAGGNLIIGAGRGTGAGTPGRTIFEVGNAGASGSTGQSATEKMRVSTTGLSVMLTADGAANLDVGSAAARPSFRVRAHDSGASPCMEAVSFGAAATLWQVTRLGEIVPGSAAKATTDTAGHAYMNTCAGTPTGVPTSYTGRVAFIYDTTNNRIYVYSGGAWKMVALA